MKLLAGFSVLSAVSLALLACSSTLGGTTAADPQTCVGYPEPRVFLENQAWWEPQAVDATRPTHPGTGEQGHIHIGTCFPAYQSLPGDYLHLDVNVKLHNITGRAVNLRVYGYGDPTLQKEFNGTQPFNQGKCDTADCETWISVDLPLKDATYNGWHEFHVFLNVIGADGVIHRNITRYYAYIDRPTLPDPPPGQTVYETTKSLRIGTQSWTDGDTWYGNVVGGNTGAYARAGIRRQDIPWKEQTGTTVSVTGVWMPTVRFESRKNFVYIDPALHATPPSHGTVVYEQTDTNTGMLSRQLAIDTTQLADGQHRLLIGSGNVGTNGTNTGLLVVPFTVDNDPCT